MIVDDEEYTREGIRDSFEWSELGIQEIMLARNGKEAQISRCPKRMELNLRMKLLGCFQSAEFCL